LQRFEQAQRAVRAAVVDEQDLHADALHREAAKLVDRQPVLFIEAGNDQDQVWLGQHGAHSTQPVQCSSH
jgi:hypothetical protein